MQGHRFDIVEDLGCRPTIYVSIAAIFIIWVPPIIVALLTVGYAGMSHRLLLLDVNSRLIYRRCLGIFLPPSNYICETPSRLQLWLDHFSILSVDEHGRRRNFLGHTCHFAEYVVYLPAWPALVDKLGERSCWLFPNCLLPYLHYSIRHSHLDLCAVVGSTNLCRSVFCVLFLRRGCDERLSQGPSMDPHYGPASTPIQKGSISTIVL